MLSGSPSQTGTVGAMEQATPGVSEGIRRLGPSCRLPRSVGCYIFKIALGCKPLKVNGKSVKSVNPTHLECLSPVANLSPSLA
jgi:hypothetical protein